MSRITNLIVYLLFFCQIYVESVSFEEDVKITQAQKLAIDRVRKRVLPYIVEDYMLDDIFIVKFLRAANFDLDRAQNKILQNIHWRNETGMRTIEKDDFSDVENDYPVLAEGYDKHGRPMFIGMASEWNIRAAIVTGRAKRVLRNLDRHMEMQTRKVRMLQQEGKNITQFVFILDLDQFSLVTHGCVQCLSAILDFLYSYENHYPGMADKVIVLNAPPTVQFIIAIVRRSVSKESNEALKIYGTNKDQWKKVLLQYIDKKYLPEELGGTLDWH